MIEQLLPPANIAVSTIPQDQYRLALHEILFSLEVLEQRMVKYHTSCSTNAPDYYAETRLPSQSQRF